MMTTTAPFSASGPPVGIRISDPSRRTLAVQWAPPPVPNGIIMSYRVCIQFLTPLTHSLCFSLQVYYTPMKSYQVTDRSYNESQQQIDVNGTQATLMNLFPATTYSVYVTAFNGAGEGNRSLTIMENTIPARKMLYLMCQ